jgi:predicted dehydrogenase
MPLEIGLIGATAIAEKAILAPAARREDVRVQAVAASDPARARDFAARNGIPRVHADYAALVDAPDLNTVYVSLHNSAHREWAVRAARAGKHVVVEKPICLSPKEFAEIAEAATVSGVHMIEAVPTAGHPWLSEVRAMITDQRYGPLRSMRTVIRFAIPTPGSYRERTELGGGIFLDCATYWLHAVQTTIGLSGARGSGRSEFDGPNGVDRLFEAALHWDDNVKSALNCEVGEGHAAEHEFTFATASVRVRGFLRPTAGALPLNLVIQHGDGTKRIHGFEPVSYYERQMDRIRAIVFTGSSGDEVNLTAAGERVAMTDAIYRCAQGRS